MSVAEKMSEMREAARELAELRRLLEIHETRGDLTLLCWCRQRPCHAEVIAKVLMNTEALRS